MAFRNKSVETIDVERIEKAVADLNAAAAKTSENIKKAGEVLRALNKSLDRMATEARPGLAKKGRSW